MGKQIYFEDIREEAEIPGFSFGPVTLEMLIRYTAAANNFVPIHFDLEIAKAQGLPGILIHGPLKFALLDRMVRDWIGMRGRVKRASANYKGMDVIGNTLICRGKVFKREIEEGEGLVTCEIWTTNQNGDVTTSGTAVVSLPRRDVEAR